MPQAVDLNPVWRYAESPAGETLRRRVEKEGSCTLPAVSPPARPFLVTVLRELFPQRPIVVVTDGLKTQELVQQDIETWFKTFADRVGIARSAEATNGDPPRNPEAAGDSPREAASTRPATRLLFYPAWDILPHEAKLPHLDVISERLETLVSLTSQVSWPDPRSAIIVTSVTALMQRTLRPEEVRARTRQLRRGDQLDPLDLVEWLEDQAYESEVKVNHKGEIALRGGIVDLYPLHSPWPVRLEFFGNELESLRYFDPVTQISREALDRVAIPPAGELGLMKRHFAPRDTAAIQTPASNAFATLLDFLPADTLLLLHDPESLDHAALEYAGLLPSDDPYHVSWEEFRRHATERGLALVQVSDPDPADVSPGSVEAGEAVPDQTGESIARDPEDASATFVRRTGSAELRFENLDAFRPVTWQAPDPRVAEVQRRAFFEQLHRWLRQGYEVHVFCNNEGERQRFGEIWSEYGLGRLATPASGSSAATRSVDPAVAARSQPGPDAPVLGPALWLGALSRGFLCDPVRLVVVTDAEIFGRYKVQRPRRLKVAQAALSRSLLDIDFTELEEGDYVVHLQHGIGRYLGLRKLPATVGDRPVEKARALASGTQECLVIEYAPRDPSQDPPKLYVPVSEAHLVSKYVGAGKARPSLSTLGGTRWAKAKENAEKAVRDLAAELLALQAARASQPGHAFGPDVPWQREFDSAFLFEETPDQMRAIVATKSDLELPRPMDRLICGDVGYGKTEVAIRAAFKAVMGGKQVAVLVPTTVLAQQHFNTFRERMADYPVRVELLSRFRSRREQQRVIQDLASGAVDLVIGTHRLLQDDVAFKDLGLVVIDEEQRFGVLHKEKLKLLRRLVDVLTLTATPIPRTLYLALTGARDMSTIETPPVDRLPVETIVCEYDERVIRDAILREIGRGGQVFFLHNRVMTIDTVAARLAALVPRARLVVGHGQMESDELERVMTRFVNGEADVLLSTTIIESGLDIPNANTIIIDRADRFGLSDLYQLRGRVGRYKHQAYAYLLIPRHARLLTDARKRISAIKQYSKLGSGFKIALRDLELRGAGNLLGAEQSGHITAVGFDLYCKLLQRSVAVLKGEKVKPRSEVVVRLDFLALNVEEEAEPGKPGAARRNRRQPGTELTVRVPRETAVYSSDEKEVNRGDDPPARPVEKASACLPSTYITEPTQRIEMYRKLVEAADEEALGHLKAELRDRFGPLPAPVELLLQVAALKHAAGERGIGVVETRDDRLMLSRGGDYVTPGGRFPRLTRRTARARLQEILRLVRQWPPQPGG